MSELHQPALSITIPTYNRSALLRQLMNRIVAEVPPARAGDVEVVISDNASTDDTAAMVEEYRQSLPRLVLVRQVENLGYDRNMLAAVAAASGDYCWLMGDDDLPEPGAIERILTILDEQGDLCGITLDRVGRSFDLSRPLPEDPLGHIPETVELHGAAQVFEATAYYLGFISAQVLHRRTWMEVVETTPIDAFCNAYVHVYVIGAMLQRRPRWLILRERLVLWRGDNDSALAQGYYKRLEIDVVGFEQITRALFGPESSTYRHVRDMMARGPFRYGITKSRLAGAWPSDARPTRALALRYYASSLPFWLITAPFVFAPNGISPLLRLGQRIVHRRRARRVGA